MELENNINLYVYTNFAITVLNRFLSFFKTVPNYFTIFYPSGLTF